MPRLVGDFDLHRQLAIGVVHAFDGHVGRLLLGQLIALGNGRGQPVVRTRHEVSLAHAQNVVELVEELQTKDVDAQQRVTAEVITDGHGGLRFRRAVVGFGIGLVLDIGDAEGQILAVVGAGHVAVLASLRITALAEFVLVGAVLPLQIGRLLEVAAHLIAVRIEDRQVNGVAAAAEPGRLDVFAVHRLHTQSRRPWAASPDLRRDRRCD